MPKREDIKNILVIGAGPILVGQSTEFDYSGVQCCDVLLREGYRVILLNSNPATVMTDKNLAHKTYIEHINIENVKRIIEIDNIGACIASFGGQTALNVAKDLIDDDSIDIEILGMSREILHNAEDRLLFRECMKKHNIPCPRSLILEDGYDKQEAIEYIGFPAILRPSFTLGGDGGCTINEASNFDTAVINGLNASPIRQVLLEQSLLGQKELEFEIIRDFNDNCVCVCVVENIDPVGMHTGDSISVAPCLTLTNEQLYTLRDYAIRCVRAVGAFGSCNVQFSLCKKTGEYNIIEMNPRVSRSSALSSKVTACPIAYISAYIMIGYTLDEVCAMSHMPSIIEASMDCVAIKIPRFSFLNFPTASNNVTSYMQSLGEVVGVGVSFESALQKAIIGMEVQGAYGLLSITDDAQEIEDALLKLDHRRLFYVADACRIGMQIDRIAELSGIDPWFISSVNKLIQEERRMKDFGLKYVEDNMHYIHSLGFSNKYISQHLGVALNDLQHIQSDSRYYRIDSSSININRHGSLYSYHPYELSQSQPVQDVVISNKPKVIILGSGPNRIAQGIEFDYCSVCAIKSVIELGYEAVVVNSNPSTVSTDPNIADRVYLEPVFGEYINDIIKHESAYGEVKGVVLQVGGQTPICLAKHIMKDVSILGTSLETVNIFENRELCMLLCESIGAKYPKSHTMYDKRDIAKVSQFPVIVRPSYVIGGWKMLVINNEQELLNYMHSCEGISKENLVVADQYLCGAVEVDVDIICGNKEIYAFTVMEQIEEAGVHSGDSYSIMKHYTLSDKNIKDMYNISAKIVQKLDCIGFVNVQFAIYNDEVYVIEINPRASRSLPIACKATGVNMIAMGIKLMLGENIEKLGMIVPKLYALKAPVLSAHTRLGCLNLPLGPAMRSTGETMCFAESVEAVYTKYLYSNFGVCYFEKTHVLFIADDISEKDIDLIKEWQALGITVISPNDCGCNTQYVDPDKIISLDVSKIALICVHGVGDIARKGIYFARKNSLHLATGIRHIEMCISAHKYYSKNAGDHKKLFSLSDISSFNVTI